MGCLIILIQRAAADKYPHYTKNGIDVKNVDEKRVPKSRESSPRDLDDEASGSYTRPGKSGRSHSHPRSGSHTGEDIADDRGSRSRSRETDMDGPRRGGRSRDGSEDRGHDYDRSRERNDSRDESRDRNGSRDVSRDRDGSRRDREDHRLAARHEVPSTEATASARMHGHINRYDADEKVRCYMCDTIRNKVSSRLCVCRIRQAREALQATVVQAVMMAHLTADLVVIAMEIKIKGKAGVLVKTLSLWTSLPPPSPAESLASRTDATDNETKRRSRKTIKTAKRAKGTTGFPLQLLRLQLSLPQRRFVLLPLDPLPDVHRM